MPGTAEFIYLLKPRRADMLATGPTPDEAAVVNRHAAYLNDLCQRGYVVLAGRTTTEDDRVFGVCILRAEDRGEAERIVEGDPAVSEGVMSANLFPFRIAMMAAQPKGVR
jgi:uncharacterized protein YciI